RCRTFTLGLITLCHPSASPSFPTLPNPNANPNPIPTPNLKEAGAGTVDV
ncbi:hypothetical protein BT96DRAFT_916256, partial [Gymnopus androsaceus JB14]